MRRHLNPHTSKTCAATLGPAGRRTTSMPRFAANLSTLYPELDFLDRFEAAAKDGVKAVEFLFPYACPAQELSSRLKAHGLQQVLFNMPQGNWHAGERGLASLPGREAE